MNEQEFEEQRQQWLRDRARLETRVTEQRRQIEELHEMVNGRLKKLVEAEKSRAGQSDAAVGRWVVDGFGKFAQIKSFGSLGFISDKGQHYWGSNAWEFCEPPNEVSTNPPEEKK